MLGEQCEEWVRTHWVAGSSIVSWRIPVSEDGWWRSLYLNPPLGHRYTDKQGTFPINIYMFAPRLLRPSSSIRRVILLSRTHNNNYSWRVSKVHHSAIWQPRKARIKHLFMCLSRHRMRWLQLSSTSECVSKMIGVREGQSGSRGLSGWLSTLQTKLNHVSGSAQGGGIPARTF